MLNLSINSLFLNLSVVRLPGSIRQDDLKFNSNSLFDLKRDFALFPEKLDGRTAFQEEGKPKIVPTLNHFEIPRIFSVDLDSLPEKKWTKPGAKISDYFNYGGKNVYYI